MDFSKPAPVRFEERSLKPYAEPVTADDLTEGEVYFSVNFADDEMLFPTMEAVVFVGRDIEVGDIGQVYFQDIDSWRAGVRYGAETGKARATFTSGSGREVNHIFEYEHALDELLRCSLRRRGRGR